MHYCDRLDKLNALNDSATEKLLRVKRIFLENLYTQADEKSSWMTPIEFWGQDDVFLNPKGTPLQICVVLQGSILFRSSKRSEEYTAGTSFIYNSVNPSWLIARKPDIGTREFLGLFLPFSSSDYYPAMLLKKLAGSTPNQSKDFSGESLDSLEKMMKLQPLCEKNPAAIRSYLRTILKNELMKVDNAAILDDIDNSLHGIERYLNDVKSVEVAHFLRENYKQKLTGKKIGEELGIGQASMRKGGSFDLSPRNFLNTLRAVRASFLINEQKIRVGKAVVKTGFSSVRQFNEISNKVYDGSGREAHERRYT